MRPAFIRACIEAKLAALFVLVCCRGTFRVVNDLRLWANKNNKQKHNSMYLGSE